ncbi:MAG: DUF1178 family protein [Polaromonas sp.]|nr:DUF1178 family protein [Polaromonas sp.]
MKVLNLQCAHQHSFEGWFGSEDDFQSQLSRGLIECPLCADTAIQKMPSAPRLHLGHAAAPVAPGTTREASDAGPTNEAGGSRQLAVPGRHDAADTPSPTAAQQAEFLHALRKVIANTEDVGERFADEARRMHHGDAETRNIRGQASLRQTLELLDEGIDVMPLPMPPALKETLQ